MSRGIVRPHSRAIAVTHLVKDFGTPAMCFCIICKPATISCTPGLRIGAKSQADKYKLSMLGKVEYLRGKACNLVLANKGLKRIIS